jgi:hypothetical protein
MIKRTDASGQWVLQDTSMNPYNVCSQYLHPNLSNAEATLVLQDITSNGFKLRTTNVDLNQSGGTYIYAAFAEAPFNYARAR